MEHNPNDYAVSRREAIALEGLLAASTPGELYQDGRSIFTENNVELATFHNMTNPHEGHDNARAALLALQLAPKLLYCHTLLLYLLAESDEAWHIPLAELEADSPELELYATIAEDDPGNPLLVVDAQPLS